MYWEKTPGEEFQEMPHTKARRFKPQARFEPTQYYWWQARKADVVTVLKVSSVLQYQCSVDAGSISSSMPDICIVYKLHLECGQLINLYDWLQVGSFNLFNQSLEFVAETNLAEMKIENCGKKIFSEEKQIDKHAFFLNSPSV